MYSIKKESVGSMAVYRLAFSGTVKNDEMQEWVEASKKELTSSPKEFCVAVDMRGLTPVAPEAQQTMQNGQKLYKEKGMVRSSVLVDKTIMKMQFERIAKETGIFEWERYFSADDAEWEAKMNAWLEKGE